jgi:DNA repair protein RecN (Recombination protein N)
MLNRIHIKDLAIFTTLEVEFNDRMTVLTGETGAGKSILIDALGLVLGDRANNGMIRADSRRAEITTAFSLDDCPAALQWLEQNGIEVDGECLLRRVLVREGTSRAYVNGSPVPIKSLQNLGELLVDIHGQHAHQSLLRRDRQRELLDEYGDLNGLCRSVGDTFAQWREVSAQLEALRRQSLERADRMDLLEYQVGELSALALGEDELDALEQEHRRLSHAGQLMQQCGLLLGLLYDEEDSTQTRLARASGVLEEMSGLDTGLSGTLEMLENASIQIGEAATNLRHYAGDIQEDPQRLLQVEARLGDIQDLARKYRCRPEELNLRLDALRGELDQLNSAGQHLGALEQRSAELGIDYRDKARELHELRLKDAARLEREVTEIIQSLGMPEGRFGVLIEALPEEKAGASGIDRVEFQVSTNPGHPLQPLAKVASGGELSRMSLAIQVATINCGQIPTLIFDEVDVGIGGGVAEIVGRLLARLGSGRQVLCVTHLPQVASQGHQHLLVQKSSNGKAVTTSIENLEQEPRVQEIARMLGGVEITDTTLEHAREMMGS